MRHGMVEPRVTASGFNAQFDEHSTWRREMALRLKLLADWMRDRGLDFDKVSATDVHTGDDAVDFDLPEEEHDFIATVKERSK